jgi:hypothetical protein
MFEVHPVDAGSYTQMWKVVKFMPSASYEIQENDIFKLGREVLKVKKISSTIDEEKYVTVLPDSDEEKLCKICCCEETSQEDPLISLCKCSGTLKFIHYTCLKHWLKGKVTRESLGSVSTYIWKELKCELCKEQLPEIFEYKGKMLSLLEISYPQSPYLILEDLKDEDEKQTMYVVALDDAQSIVIGRGGESEIRLNDISVSRIHARIKYFGNKFYLTDNKSKFGTLVLVNGQFSLPCGKDNVFQINKTIVSLKVHRPWKCCGKKTIYPE